METQDEKKSVKFPAEKLPPTLDFPSVHLMFKASDITSDFISELILDPPSASAHSRSLGLDAVSSADFGMMRL